MAQNRHVLYIGRKPVMSYVLALMAHFNSADVKTATLKARGRAINTAVDVVEITRRQLLPTVQVDDIEVGTEIMPEETGRHRPVSTIAIHISLAEPTR